MAYEQAQPQPSAENISFLPLYISFLNQTFGDRLWSFALPILFTEIFVTTIMPQAILTFGIYSAVFLAMPAFGSWIDTTNRWKVVTTTIFIQNVCVVISSIFLFIIGLSFDPNPALDAYFILLFMGILIPSMVGEIMGMGAKLALQKDWVPVLCQGNTSLLTTINARMRRIDLFCKLMAPAIFGIVTQFLGDTPKKKIQYGALWIMLWNVVGFFLEYWTLRMVYKSNPILVTHSLKGEESAKVIVSPSGDGYKPTKEDEEEMEDTKDEKKKGNDDENRETVETEEQSEQEWHGEIAEDTLMIEWQSEMEAETLMTGDAENGQIQNKKKKKKEGNISKLVKGWAYYYKSQMFWCSIAYCMLYCSVLDSNSLVHAYLKTEGISYFALGVTKGLGACCGILGTMLTPCLRNRCGLKMELIGLGTIWLFWCCLAPCGIQFTAQKVFGDDEFSLLHYFDDSYIILFCMIIARCGLWAFDLVENQLMQERVREDVRAKVNGVQVSVSQLFFILVSVFAMIWSQTNEFYILVLGTLANIFCAALIYTLWFLFKCCRNDRNEENNLKV